MINYITLKRIQYYWKYVEATIYIFLLYVISREKNPSLDVDYAWLKLERVIGINNIKVLIVDDLLATGGTMEATIKLVEKLGGTVVGLAFLIELSELNGREKLIGHDILTLINY